MEPLINGQIGERAGIRTVCFYGGRYVNIPRVIHSTYYLHSMQLAVCYYVGSAVFTFCVWIVVYLILCNISVSIILKYIINEV